MKKSEKLVKVRLMVGQVISSTVAWQQFCGFRHSVMNLINLCKQTNKKVWMDLTTLCMGVVLIPIAKRAYYYLIEITEQMYFGMKVNVHS